MKKIYCDICGKDLSKYLDEPSSHFEGGYRTLSSYYSINDDYCSTCTKKVMDLIYNLKEEKK